MQSVDEAGFMTLLFERIALVDFDNAKKDAERFIGDRRVLDLWSQDYFMELARRMKFCQAPRGPLS
jgi:hypothetical protein